MKQDKKPRLYLPLLVKYLAPLKRGVIMLALLIFSKIALQLINPQIMKRFIDQAQIGEPLRTLLGISVLFIGVAIFQQLLAIASTYFAENVGWKSTNALRVDLARHCLDLDMEFHSRHSPGEMIERVDGDVMKLASFFSQFTIEIIGNGILLIGIMALMIGTDILVGAPMLIVTLAALVVLVRIQRFGSKLWESHRQAEADLFGYLEERLSATEDIRALDAVSYMMRGFYKVARTVVYALTRAGTWGAGTAHNSAHILSYLGIAVTLGIGAALFAKGRITIGTLYILYHYAGMTRHPVDNLAHQMRELQQAAAGIARIRTLFSRSNPLISGDGNGFKAPATLHGSFGVVFDRVSFTYPESKDPVLEDLSFHLEAGKVLGLLGRTGSGKTTISRLLYRFYAIDSGNILLKADGVNRDIAVMSLGDLRGNIGMVTQNIQLYNASIRDNITVFDPEIPNARIMEVIDQLELGTWISRFPEGIDSTIRESEISAGEAQLVAFARVFLRNPGIVILDEASSRLDPATEYLIEHAVDELLTGRTAIVIAHRLRTVHRADSILILKDGAIEEFGDRKSLLSDSSSLFSRLLSKDTGGLLDEVLA